MKKKTDVVHVCGYFGPDPGRDKPLKSARGCLKRMAFCQAEGQKSRGTTMNMTWMYWFGEFGLAFDALKKRWPRAYAKYMAEEDERLKNAPPITLDGVE